MTGRYPAYKPTALPWLPEVPEHWEMTKLRYLTRFNNGLAFKPGDWKHEGVPIIRIQNLNGGSDFNFTDRTDLPDDLLVRPGDLLFSWSGNKGTSFGPFIWDRDFCAYLNQHIFKLDGYRLDKQFFYYLLKAVTRHIENQAHGIIGLVHVTKPELGSVAVFLPPPAEQAAIVAFIERQMAELARLVGAKRRLLALLDEQRAAVIARAVTLGLDPNAPRRKTGLPWLPEVPEGWEVKKLKYLLREKLKYGANEEGYEDTNAPRYVRITDFNFDGKLRDDTFKSLPMNLAQPYLLEEGDILLARSGATVGKSFQFKNYEGDACFAGYLIKASPHPKIVMSDFLYAFTKSGAYEIWKSQIFIQSTIQNISAEKYASLEIPLPPLAEQAAIVEFIERETADIEATKGRIRRELELLEEWKTALISAVVTGRIRVSD